MAATSQEFRALDAEIDRLTVSAGRLEPSPRRVLPAPRFARLLVAVDASEGAAHALAWARLLRASFGSEIIFATVSPSLAYFAYLSGVGAAGLASPSSAAMLSEDQQAASNDLLEGLRHEEAADGHDVRTLLLEGHAGEQITRAAEENECDLILLGAGRGGVERLLLGSIADHVKDHAHCSVLLAKGPPPPGNVLVAVDGSTGSRLAAHAGDTIARAMGRDVTLLHALPKYWHSAYDDASMERLRAYERAGAASGLSGHVHPTLRLGDPREVIPREARDTNASLVVLGTRGITGIRRLVTGSVSARVTHTTDRSVLLVRERE